MEENNLNKEKMLEDMRHLREKRDFEIVDNNMNNNKEKNDDKVKDVLYLGEIEYIDEKGENVKKGVFLVIEQREDENGNLIEIERYYDENGELLGGNNKKDAYNFIMLNEKNMNNQELLERLKELDKNGIISLEDLEKERLEEIAKSMGVEVEDIKKLQELDIEEIEKTEEELDEKVEKKDDKKDDKIEKEEVEKISTKTEIDINQKVTDTDTMASLLRIQDKGYVKIGVVYSDKLKDSNGSTTFCFVGIKKDGSAEKIDSLEEREGFYPSNKVYSMNEDGSKIEQEQMHSIYRVKECGNERQIGVRISDIGTIETSILRTPRDTNREAIAAPIQNSYNSIPTSREVSRMMTREKNIEVDDEIEMIEKEQELEPENNITIDKIDVDEKYLYKMADEILENNEEIAKIYNREDVKYKLIEEIAQNGENKDYELIKNQVEEQMEEDSKEEHEPPQRYEGNL